MGKQGWNLTGPTDWIDFPSNPSNIKYAKGKVILLQKDNRKFYNASSTKNVVFSSRDDIASFDLNSDWAVWNNTNANNNKVIYDKIVGSNKQTGFTGIVTIPNVEKTYDKTYGDLLLQAVIDCNFKLH